LAVKSGSVLISELNDDVSQNSNQRMQSHRAAGNNEMQEMMMSKMMEAIENLTKKVQNLQDIVVMKES